MRASGYFRYATFLLVAWTGWWLCVRIRKPRRSLRELAGSYGTSACLTVAILLIARLILVVLTAIATRLSSGEFDLDWPFEFRDFGDGPAFNRRIMAYHSLAEKATLLAKLD